MQPQPEQAEWIPERDQLSIVTSPGVVGLQFYYSTFVEEFGERNEGIFLRNEKEGFYSLVAGVGGQFGSVLKCTYDLETFEILEWELTHDRAVLFEMDETRLAEIGEIFLARMEQEAGQMDTSA